MKTVLITLLLLTGCAGMDPDSTLYHGEQIQWEEDIPMEELGVEIVP